MAGIDFYAHNNGLDGSIAVYIPKGLNQVIKEVTKLLNSRGSIVVDEGNISLDRASELVTSSTGDHSTYYMINSSSEKVWSILKRSIESDDIRVVAIVHGSIPKNFPENVIPLSVGSSLHGKVSPFAAAEVRAALDGKNKFPKEVTDNVYFAFQVLCYEVLYSPEFNVFKKDQHQRVPRAVAFDFLYNPPAVLNANSMTSAVYRFLEDVHG